MGTTLSVVLTEHIKDLSWFLIKLNSFASDWFPAGIIQGLNVFRLFVITASVAKYLSHQSNYLMKTTPESFL